MLKSVGIWLVIGLVVLIVVRQFDARQTNRDAVSYTEFMEQAKDGKVESATIEGRTIRWIGSDKKTNTTYSTGDIWMVGDLVKDGVKVQAKPEEEQSFLAQVFISWFPMLLLIGVWIFFMRQMQGGGRGGAFSFGKSKARMLDESNNTVTFADVAGCDEAKEEVSELVEFLRDPSKFQKLGGRIPRGVLMVGNPGTGKTLLAKAIAGEAKVPFFSISGSDFVEMFVGVGAARVRDMFEQAKKNAPCIVFIDEIDAVGRQRGAGLGGGNDEREQTLNQLLVEMDGFEGNSGVIVIAATNRPDVLDPALMRPGRFDRQVVVPLPDIRGREQILLVHMRKVPLASDVKAEVIARGTPGFSGADLANLVNEAALFAARKSKRLVDMDDFEMAKDKIMMGAERKSMVMSDEEKKNTAYHESGHTVVAKLLPKSDPVHKVTIIPRGRALGVTMQLPEQDRYSYDRDFLLQRIAVLFGGRIAEEIFMHHVTTGAGNDIERATDMARKMVCEWGMSDLGPLSFGKREEQIFLGREIAQHRDYSEATAIRIDEQVKKLVQEGYDRARKIIEERSDALDRIARALLEREVLDGSEVRQLIDGETLEAMPAPPPPSSSGDGTQQVIKPEPPRRLPGMLEGGPQPA
jgi:cell division protease FtsH